MLLVPLVQNFKMMLMSLLCTVFLLFFSLDSILVNGSTIENELENRILYGTEANIREFPYFASLGNCGAGILSDRWIVTAAHCLVPSTTTKKSIWVGGESIKNSQELQYDKVIIHPKYREKPILINDIALIRLVTPLTFNDKVKPLQLPKQDSMKNPNHLFVGRGMDQTNRPTTNINKVDLIRITGKQCLSHLSKRDEMALRPHLKWLEKAIVCAKRTDDRPSICFGDSGGPLTQGNTLVGLASFVGKKCKETRLGFFTNVASYVPWIKSHTGL